MDQSNQFARWPLPVRIVVLVVVMVYLIIMIWAPLTTPFGAPYLTEPVEAWIAPAQHALHLRHGYRFFAPDPGPTHSLVYEITTREGQQITGHFPDRENTSPRLLYHRWFMLAETLFRECSQLPTEQQLAAELKYHQNQVAALTQAGRDQVVQELIVQRDRELAVIQQVRQRCDLMLQSTARAVMNRHAVADSEFAPQSIRLWIQSRSQPTAEECINGLELTDPVLRNRVEVGIFQADQLNLPTSTEPSSGADQPPTDTGADASRDSTGGIDE